MEDFSVRFLCPMLRIASEGSSEGRCFFEVFSWGSLVICFMREDANTCF